MALWGQKRCRCAVPDCPDGEKIFENIGGIGSGLGHLERVHNIVGMNAKDALIILMDGRGGLAECPKCNSSNIETWDRDYPDHENAVEKVSCRDCGATFIEHWKAVGWEEET